MALIFICPVCGREVKIVKGGYEYKHRIYFFCSEKCKKKFKLNPEEYVK